MDSWIDTRRIITNGQLLLFTLFILISGLIGLVGGIGLSRGAGHEAGTNSTALATLLSRGVCIVAWNTNYSGAGLRSAWEYANVTDYIYNGTVYNNQTHHLNISAEEIVCKPSLNPQGNYTLKYR